MFTIDLNADLGEGGPSDAALMPMVSSCNIACGGHAGSSELMRTTVELALQHQVAIGAHPGHEDPEHFGRRPIQLEPQAARALFDRQIQRLLAIHPSLHHIKPHGALYHQANQSAAIAESLIAVMLDLVPGAWLYAPPEGELAKAAHQAGVPFCSEGFIDRRYQQDGSLCQHHETDAHIVNPCEATAQALGLALDQHVSTRNFKRIRLRVRSLCVHGDSPVALHTLRLARKALLRSWVTIAAP